MRVISDGAPKWATSWAEKSVDPVEQRAAYVAAERHRDPRAEVHRRDRERDLHERDQQHDAADLPDVVGVAGEHALVDDVGVQRGQEQRAHRLHEREPDDDEQRLGGSGAGTSAAAGSASRSHAFPVASGVGRATPSRNNETISADASGSSRMSAGWVPAIVRPREQVRGFERRRAGSGRGRLRTVRRARGGRATGAFGSRLQGRRQLHHPDGGAQLQDVGDPAAEDLDRGDEAGLERQGRVDRGQRGVDRRGVEGGFDDRLDERSPCRGRPGRWCPRRCRRPRRSGGS